MRPVVKDLSAEIGGCLIEGAKVHNNSLMIMTSYKKVYYISNINKFKTELLCEEAYGKLM